MPAVSEDNYVLIRVEGTILLAILVLSDMVSRQIEVNEN